MNDYLAEPCIFGLKEKIERTKREIAEAKRLEFELGDEIVEIVDDDDFPVPTWNPEEWPDAQPRVKSAYCHLFPHSRFIPNQNIPKNASLIKRFQTDIMRLPASKPELLSLKLHSFLLRSSVLN